MSSNTLYFKDSFNNFYVIGNIQEKWMGNRPLLCSMNDKFLKLQYLQDLAYSDLKNENEKICFSIFKIKGETKFDFDSNIRSLIYNKLSSDKYEKIKDIEYIIDTNNQTQYYDNIEVKFCLNKVPNKFGDKIYIDCPTIYIKQ